MTDIAQDAVNVAAAVTGADTPANVKTSRPTKEAVWTIFAAMGVASAIGVFVIVILAWFHPKGTEAQAVMFLGIMGVLAQICIPVGMIALASSRLGRVEASAGNNHITLSGRQGD